MKHRSGKFADISASSTQNASTDEARQIRKNLTEFFMSPEGELSWQYDKVRYNNNKEEKKKLVGQFSQYQLLELDFKH